MQCKGWYELIRMRTNREPDAICCECGSTKSDSLEMFDVCIGGKILTICDLCNDNLFKKTLRASYNVNTKTKSKKDLVVIRRRNE